MKILLSIKPEYAEKILSGEKSYEFRRAIPKSNDVSTVVIYASSPIQKVIGEFQIKSILKHSLESLWSITASKAGIDKEFYDGYFSGKEHGYAFEVQKAKRYKKQLELADLDINHAPQSFIYLDKELSAA